MLGVGGVLGALLAYAGSRYGAAGVLAPLGLALLFVLVLHPELFLYVTLSVSVLVELNDPILHPLDHALYNSVIKGLTPIDLLVLLLSVAVLLDAHRQRRRLRGVGWLGAPLLVLLAATAGGVVTGHYGGASARQIYEPVVIISHLLLIPFIVVNVIRDSRSATRLLELLIVLVLVKSVLGLLVVGTSGLADVNGQTASFLEPSANWLAIVFVLCVVAAALRRVRIPWWVYVSALLPLASLILSYRRGFWVGAVLGLAVMTLIGSGPRGRRVVVPGVALLGVLATLALSSVGGTGVSGSPLLARAASLNPSRLTANAEDRYRLDERRNVLANLSVRPFTGLGIGVPWTAPFPLSVQHPGDRLYAHMIVLWYWMKLGLPGLLAYMLLMIGVLRMAYDVYRHHPRPGVRALGLGVLGSAIALIAAETTGSFTGVEPRFSIVLPVVLGVLAHAWLQMRDGMASGHVI